MPAATPAADAVLERGVFPNRIRQLLQAALTGRLAHVAAIVLPRTSDPDYKAFLYLQELRRRGRLRSLPPVLLFDLLQSQGPDMAAYDTARMRELLALAAREIRQACDAARSARADRARQCSARCGAAAGGTCAGIRRVCTAPQHAAIAGRALAVCRPSATRRWRTRQCETLAVRPPLAGPRVLLAGAPVDSPALHASIESLHATVVDEISPFGSDARRQDIDARPPIRRRAGRRGTARILITARAPGPQLLRRIEEFAGRASTRP